MDSTFSPGALPTLKQSRARLCGAYDSPLNPTPTAYPRVPRSQARTPSPFPAYRADSIELERPVMADTCSVNSSPSLYSHAASHVGHGGQSRGQRMADRMSRWGDDEEGEGDEYGEVPCTQSRISMVSGPRVTKYAEIPWEDIVEGGSKGSSSGNLGRIIRAATRTNVSQISRPGSPHSSGTLSTDTTRKALALFGGGGGGKGKHFNPSSSGVSLASTQTVSTASSDERAQPITPRLKPAFGSPPSLSGVEMLAGRGYDEVDMLSGGLFGSFKAGKNELKLDPSPIPHHLTPGLRGQAPDRPLLSSGSPGFGLISLEAAQERERLRAHRRTGMPQGVQPTPRAPATERNSFPDSLLDSDAALNAGIAKSIKQKKSLMKLFKNDKVGSSSGSSSGFSLVTPALPAVPKLPTSAIPIRPTMDRGDSSDSNKLRAGGSVWSDASESAVWPTRSPQAAQSSAQRVSNPGNTVGLLKPRLELRPISMSFSNGLPSSYLSDISSASPMSSSPPRSIPLTPTEHDPAVAETIKEQIANARKGWMVQLFELEAQIRELKDALAEAKAVKPGRCNACGCGCGGHLTVAGKDLLRPGGGVMDRGRAKTGGARGVFGSGSLYEWE